jgi:hypothetical protein
MSQYVFFILRLAKFKLHFYEGMSNGIVHVGHDVWFQGKRKYILLEHLRDSQNRKAQLHGDFDQCEVHVSCPFSADIGYFYVMHLLHRVCSLFSCNPTATHHYRYY